MNLSEVIVTNILRPNHLTSLHCLSGAARGGEEKLGKANIAKSFHSTSVCSPGLSDHAMYEVDLERSSEATATELRVVHC